ncbi:MAG: protein translocase subunit SecF [Halobacteria archaeon]|nr:protein translocase subunit SecF [Halobacteria archaeon]
MITVEDIDYTEYSNLQLLVVPALLLVFVGVVVGATYVTTGSPVSLGFEFTGGAEVQVTTDAPIEQVRSDFSGIQGLPNPANVRSISTGYIVTYKPTAGEGVLSNSQTTKLQDFLDANYPQSSISQIAPTYGSSLLVQGVWAVVFAFLIMSVTVFAFFRTFVPSIAVVLSAFSDMVVPIAFMNLLGIELSLATIPAVLLLIGYSIDSDILLTRNVLEGRRSQFYENVKTAMKTGITMTTTSMGAMAVMAVTSHLFSIFVLRDIGIILFVGLGTDILNTYMMNVALLRRHVLGPVSPSREPGSGSSVGGD